ncbi:MAG: hypothetical protein CMF62_03020 [Magnetococcales bacterium]|nr:hypothetical protein [Magnetococcales bacterium]|tara:strand:- start:17390 stop:18160 length:771 start_codon:yes stop_codon:yes gene_type:complete
MSGKLIKYRIYCETDSKWEFVWREENQSQPTTCPVDTNHNINSSSVAIVDERSELKVQIQEEKITTGGHFRLEDYTFTCLGNQTTFFEFSIPTPSSVLSYKLVVQPNMGGDEFGGIVGPDTIIGAIGSPVGTSDTTFTVTNTVIENAFLGASCNLFDGTNTDEVGFIIGIDSENSTITVQNTPSNTYSPLTPTYVRIGVKMANDIKLPYLPNGGYMEVGQSKIGASHLPANTITRVRYKNNTSETKECHVLYEYLY